MKIKYFALTMGILMMLESLPSMAQIEEIIVTATRRETNVQDTGISVTALSAEILDQFNITTTEELTIITPGLMFQNGGGSPLVGLVSIRGVSQNDFAGHIESPNALYVDEVYQASISTNSIKMFDINRAEVLRGPQGTLFGRNATGGLIHVVTNKPTEEREGYLKGNVGSFDSYSAEAAISGPLGDTIQARLAVFFSGNDGHIKNDLGPDQQGDNTKAGRLHVAFNPTEKLDILLTASIFDYDVDGIGGAFSAGATVDPVTGFGVPAGPANNTVTGYIDADGDKYTGSFNQSGFLDREYKSLSGKITYAFSDDMSVVSISNFHHVKTSYLEDNDLTPIPFTEFDQTANIDVVSEELRLEHDDGGPLRWSAGVYFINIDGNYTQGLGVTPPPFFDAAALALSQEAVYALETTSYSVFGQGEYDFNEKLTLTAGLRWTYDEKDYAYNTNAGLFIGGALIPGVIPLGVPPGSLIEAVANSGGVGVTDSHDEDGISARLQLDYSVNQDWLLYASFNKGYKAFNYNAGFAGFAPIAGLRFKGEDIFAYEIGSKVDFWDGKGRWNISGYYYDYNDYQAFDQRGINFTLFNTDATIGGMDTELTLRPGPGTTLMVGAAYLDTKVKDVLIGTDPLNPISVDREAPQSPEFTLSGAFIQDFHIADGTVSLQLSAYYNSGYFSQLTNSPITDIPDYVILNGRLTYTSANEKYQVSAFARNLLDKEYITYAFDIASNGFQEQNLGVSRWAGVEARYNFW
jgi:iron complex outermembrane recepter protein